MANPIDKHGKTIRIKDKVNVLVTTGLPLGTPMEFKEEAFAIVIEWLPEENKLKCMPIKAGLPFKVSTSDVEVVDSLIANLLDASIDMDFSTILQQAHERLEIGKTTATRSAKGAVKVDLAVGLKMDELE